MSDDYYRVFYYWEPAINHHHYTLDGSAVLFHDHDGPGDILDKDLAHFHNGRISYGTDDRIFDDVLYGPPHYYGDNVVRVHHTRNRYTIVNDYDPADDNVTLNITGFDAIDYFKD